MTATTAFEFTHHEQPLRLRGVNLGSWLNLEDFMLGLDGTDWQIRHELRDQLGEDVASAFFEAFTRCFITHADLRKIADLGFNSVRLPFNWRYFESDAAPGIYRPEMFLILDRLFNQCTTADLCILLDFHACPEGQNTTPPADNPTGYARFWGSIQAQDRVAALWCELTRRYCRHPALLGYNLINEPQTNMPGELSEAEQNAAMNRFYHRLIRDLRAIDPDGWIVIEGPVRQSGGSDCLDPELFKDPHTAATFHHYPLFEDSLQLNDLRLPESADLEAHRAYLRCATRPEQEFIQRIQRPMLLGEYGLSARWEPARAQAVFQAQTDVAEEMGFSWMIWTWKDIWRLGLMTPKPDTPWLRFVRSDELLQLSADIGRELRAAFDTLCTARLPHADENRWLKTAAFEDVQRGLNRLLLHHQARCLAKFSPDQIIAMADSFALENCTLREDYYAAVRPYLTQPSN